MRERTGYVFKQNGKWRARVTFTDRNGKRRNLKRTASSKSDANAKLRELLNEAKAEIEKPETAATVKTFGELCDYYEEHYAKEAQILNDQKVGGLRDYKRVQSFVRVFRSHFGNKRLDEITYDDLRNFREKRSKVPNVRGGLRSVTTLNRELTYLRRVFNVAVRRGWMDRNPFACGEPLIQTAYERKRERILTPEEEARLLAACESDERRRHLRPLLIALLDTGARKGEMLKLRWKEVDLDAGVITLRATNTKTLRTRRLPITARLRAELSNLWEMSEKDPEALVFGIRHDVKRSFASACREAGIAAGGIDGLNIHCLRHTAATRLVQGQMPIELVGRILGHTQPQTTYRYISATESALSKARAILESSAATIF